MNKSERIKAMAERHRKISNLVGQLHEKSEQDWQVALQEETEEIRKSVLKQLRAHANDEAIPKPKNTIVDLSDTPSHIGEFKVIKKLSSPSNCELYIAKEKNGREILIKRASDKSGIESLKREAKFLYQNQINGIPACWHFDLDADSPYISLEYFSDALHIDDYCKNLDLKNKIEVFAQLCETTARLHNEGTFHGDIKNSNVLVVKSTDSESRVINNTKLIDFGTVQNSQSAGHVNTSYTPNYASPELHQGENKIRAGSDIYALGILLYRIVEKAAPYEVGAAANLKDITIRPMQCTNKRLRSIVRKCLQYNENDRYRNANELFADVKCYLEDRKLQHASNPWSLTIPHLIRDNLSLSSWAAGVLVIAIAFFAIKHLIPPPPPELYHVPAVVDSYLHIDSPLVVFDHETLILEGGELDVSNASEVKLREDASIIVLGKFRAIAKQDAPLNFSPEDSNATWRGIHAIGKNADIRIKHCKLERGNGIEIEDLSYRARTAIEMLETDAFLSQRGGLLSATQAKLNCQNVTFNQGQSKGGGAVSLRSSPPGYDCNKAVDPGIRIKFENCSFQNNKVSGNAQAPGGAMVVYKSAVNLLNCEFSNNKALGSDSSGGALYLGSLSIGEVTGSFKNNYANGDGGAIFVWGSYSNKNLPTTSDNPFVQINRVSFFKNRARQKGGAIAAQNNTGPRITNSTFEANHATQGGAIYYAPNNSSADQAFMLGSCKFEGNFALQCGSDLAFDWPYLSALHIENCTFDQSDADMAADVFLKTKNEGAWLSKWQKECTSIAPEEFLIATSAPPPFPFVAQHDDQSCQSACLAMLLSQITKIKQTSSAVRGDLLKLYPNRQDSHSSWSKYLNSALETNWKVEYLENEEEAFKLIKKQIDAGRPVPMSATFTKSGHVFAAIGYRTNKQGQRELYCCDPNGEFDFTSSSFNPDRDSGAGIIYPLDKCIVRVEYKGNKFRKLTIGDKPASWSKEYKKDFGKDGIHYDWEMLVQE